MLTDSFMDFTFLVKEPDADLSAELATLEADLDVYADAEYGYSRQVFPLLRKAARWHVDGKFSSRALHAISLRLSLYYVFLEGTEESLVEDLRAYVRVKPTIDLRTVMARICRRRRAAIRAEKQELPTYVSGSLVSATTSTGVILRLVQ